MDEINDLNLAPSSLLESKIWDAKVLARPEISKSKFDWQQFNHAESCNLNPDQFPDTIERIDFRKVSNEQFRNEYEYPYKPVMITNGQNSWPAMRKWTLRRLMKKYRNQRFKCGESDDGHSVKIKLKYFIQYMLTNTDDSPLYIFDGSFGEHPKKRKLLEDYYILPYFSEDLFQYGGESRRPPYRWFLLGPKRSGSGIHIDPLGTSAWNALISGKKLWCLFPPNTPKSMIKPQIGEGGKNKNEAITWFKYVYVRTQGSLWPPEFKPIVTVQQPGETIFVPGGWWHVVLNLDHTVAVTQNMCSSGNFRVVWHKTSRARPKFASRMLSVLKEMRPDLFTIASTVDINRPIDGVPQSSSSSGSSSSSSSASSSCDSNSSSDKESYIREALLKYVPTLVI
ncbi:jumonji domain-containing protein 6 [Cichlidogyrus casuarinus]|uniref:Jumonji domain-containing protein 6 n=1 Tax=Cichlidogyrus casuarinus TaxID=1844966 RepID=A0ABD2QQ65_9PLAT